MGAVVRLLSAVLVVRQIGGAPTGMARPVAADPVTGADGGAPGVPGARARSHGGAGARLVAGRAPSLQGEQRRQRVACWPAVWPSSASSRSSPRSSRAISLYGLVADPPTVAAQIDETSASALPGMPRSRWSPTSSTSVVSASNGAARHQSGRLAAGRAVVGASSGTSNLIEAVNIAYDEEEGRGSVKLRGTRPGPHARRDRVRAADAALVAVVPVVLDALQLGRAAGSSRRSCGGRCWSAWSSSRSPWSTGSPPTATPRASAGSAPARWSRPSCGSSAASCSASTSTTSAATTRPTAPSPASSC